MGGEAYPSNLANCFVLLVHFCVSTALLCMMVSSDHGFRVRWGGGFEGGKVWVGRLTQVIWRIALLCLFIVCFHCPILYVVILVLTMESCVHDFFFGVGRWESCILDAVPTWFLKSNCELFADVITRIVNLSLSTGVFPDSLKHAIIGPLIKKQSLDRNTLKNYRPVSNIKFLSKVIERIVVNNITKHMNENNLGEPLQSAYRAAHSTETALLKVKDDIMTSLHHRKGVFLVLLDLSAAFDTVSHSILFQRMQDELGLTGTALQWIKSYFSDRTTSVCINGCHSPKSSLKYGLPQGSIVGPVSFSIYTIPIGRIIRKHSLFISSICR